MKRSEMVEVIEDYLIISEDMFVSNKDKAEYILGCCETWGMLPPATVSELQNLDISWDDE